MSTRAGEAAGAALPGSLFVGRYELVSRIGAGGMGEVFRARAAGAGGFEKEVVIKRILPHLASDPGFVQRFIEEGKLVVKLRHAGIAQVLDMGEDGGVFFIAMEHVDGKDLGELMRIAGAAGMKMPLPLVVHLLVALLDALDYAHRARDTDGRPLGIIHRDVSPSNVMIATTGEVKLLDFGIARATERLQASTTGAIRGKYSYMSPQQAAGLELDARSDLFSVGVIAWELLTGERPFDGSSDLLTLDRIRFHDPGRLRDRVPDLPEDIEAICARLLAKDPAARFASADEAAQALRGHMVRSGRLGSSRELAAWMDEVLASLPKPLRERSVQGLSVDELLRLSLDGGDPAPVRTPSGNGLVVREARAVTVAASELAADSAGAARAALAATPEATPLATPAPRERDGRFPWWQVGLVGLNVVLIALVLWLVLRPGSNGGEDEAGALDARIAAAPEVLATSQASADSAAPDSAPADTLAAAVETQAPPPAAPATSGVVAGEALALLGESALAEDVALVVRVHPPGATVSISGHGSGRAPRTIKARPGTVVSGRASAPDHEPRAFEAVVGEDEALTVTLKPVPRGKVQFKFFPAEGTRVLIDGKPLALGSNVVATELPVGRHTLLLETRDGKRLTRSFDVDEGQTTNLGTLDVGG